MNKQRIMEIFGDNDGDDPVLPMLEGRNRSRASIVVAFLTVENGHRHRDRLPKSMTPHSDLASIRSHQGKKIFEEATNK